MKRTFEISGRVMVEFRDGGKVCVIEVGLPSYAQFVQVVSHSRSGSHPAWMKHADGRRFKITVEDVTK